MAKRYIICPVIGDGTFPHNTYRAAARDVADTGINAIIPTHTSGADTGKPKYLFCFAIVSTEHLAEVAAISNTYVLPDHALDTEMGAMEAGARTALTQSVEAFDLNGANLHIDVDFTNEMSYRQVLQSIGEQFEPAFNIDFFDAN